MKLKNDGELEQDEPKPKLSRSQKDERIGLILLAVGWLIALPIANWCWSENGAKTWAVLTVGLLITIGFTLINTPVKS